MFTQIVFKCIHEEDGETTSSCNVPHTFPVLSLGVVYHTPFIQMFENVKLAILCFMFARDVIQLCTFQKKSPGMFGQPTLL